MTTTSSILSQVYSTVSNYINPTATKSISQTQPIQPVVFHLSDNTEKVYFMQTNQTVAAFDASTKEIYVYNYSDGQLKHVLKCNGNVVKMQNQFADLFAQTEGGVVQAWNVDTGKPLDLPETWNKINNMFFLRHFTVLVHAGTVLNSPLSLTLCNRNYQPIKKVSTEYFKVHDIVDKVKNLFVTGIESNPFNAEVQSGFIMAYQDLDKEDFKRYKLNYVYDSKVVNPNVLNINSGLIYNSKWSPSTSCVWDYNTLSTVLAKTAEKNVDESTLVGVLGYTIVVADRKEIAVYTAIGELEVELPLYLFCHKELGLEQAYGTKQLNKVKTIECQKGDPVKCIHLFKLSGEAVMAEGYECGKVIIRNLNTLAKMFEFIPPSNMKNVCTFKTNYEADRLFVHYGTPSVEGTLGIVWDTTQQKPFLYVSRDALKNRAYDSTKDTIHYEYGDDLVIRSENEALNYKGAMKSEKTS